MRPYEGYQLSGALSKNWIRARKSDSSGMNRGTASKRVIAALGSTLGGKIGSNPIVCGARTTDGHAPNLGRLAGEQYFASKPRP
jgi:hypothetical protein